MAIYSYGSVSPRSKIKYFTTGPRNMAELQQIFDDQAIDLAAVGDILDFAGGYGRLTRYLVQIVPRDRVTHADISPEAVRWVGERLRIPSFVSTLRPQDLQHQGQYDLILAISLFSHLLIGTWGGWLCALYALLNPGGTLIFTTLGEKRRAEITPEMQAMLRREEDGFEFVPVNETLGRLPEEQYGSSYLTHAWVERYIRERRLGTLVGMYGDSLWAARMPGFCGSLTSTSSVGPVWELNQSHGGICMVWLVQDRVNGRCEVVSLRLQGTSAAAFDLVGAVGDVAEELADVLLDLGLGAEAGVGGDLLADPAPDGLVRVEVRAVGRQADEAEV